MVPSETVDAGMKGESTATLMLHADEEESGG